MNNLGNLQQFSSMQILIYFIALGNIVLITHFHPFKVNSLKCVYFINIFTNVV